MKGIHNIHFRMPDIMIQRLDEIREDTGETRSHVIRRAINEYIQGGKKE